MLERRQLAKATCGNVRFWHKADIEPSPRNARFLGVMRTSNYLRDCALSEATVKTKRAR
jgi:hypothetical protein